MQTHEPVAASYGLARTATLTILRRVDGKVGIRSSGTCSTSRLYIAENSE